jgi:hypothetical protein
VVGGGPVGTFCWNVGVGAGLGPVNGEGGLISGAIGVRVLTGFASIGGSFQFSVLFLRGGGGRSEILEIAGFVGCNPGLNPTYWLGYCGVYCDWPVGGLYTEGRTIGFGGRGPVVEVAGRVVGYVEEGNVGGCREGGVN